MYFTLGHLDHPGQYAQDETVGCTWGPFESAHFWSQEDVKVLGLDDSEYLQATRQVLIPLKLAPVEHLKLAPAGQLVPEQESFALRVLGLFAKHDCYSHLFWRTDGEFAPITFMVICNDIFYCASDCEDVTPDNIATLEKAFDECKALDQVDWAPSLFVARVRGLRPQNAAYPTDCKALDALLDACGPERTR
jgi:hypothetical protein